jgi:8-oxo-dGTP pyrophosphatase MutT (NUDIX family)
MWLTAEQLLAPPAGVDLSPTMKAIVPTVLKVIPPVTRPLRKSEGAVALIHGTNRHGERTVLAQWNEKWKAFFLIGGHRHPNETFPQCVAREIGEELDLKKGEPDEFVLDPPYPPLEYVAWSRGYEQYTAYTMHRFDVNLTPAGRAAIEAKWGPLRLYWLTESEIRARQTTDGRRVSETVQIVT